MTARLAALAAAVALTLALGPAGPARADLAAEARAAAAALREAAAMLAQAEETGGARARLEALTATVRAHEEGLAALREGLRRAAAERARLEARLAAERDGIARLLGVLQAVGEAPAPVLLLHPSGPLGTARAGMILADVAPALKAEAEALRAELVRLAEIETVQAEALATLEQGLAGVQAARAALAAASADRADLPRAFREDPVATALLIASTDTLDAFAAGLAETVEETVAPGPDASAARGSLALPVRGAVLRRAGEADASGAVRPGLVIATEPRALVVAPAAATLRFQGPLLDLGQVAILEPAPGTLLVFAGLAEVWGAAGEILSAGAPVGLMGGETPDGDAILSGPAPETRAELSETLYLEVREGGVPVDPATWFALGEEVGE
jgi:septal ring factor EnvC (AmiA/AmiB activator)